MSIPNAQLKDLEGPSSFHETFPTLFLLSNTLDFVLKFSRENIEMPRSSKLITFRSLLHDWLIWNYSIVQINVEQEQEYALN